MDFSNLKNKLLICLCCFVLILPFYLVTFCYADDDISPIPSKYFAKFTGVLEEQPNVLAYYFPVEFGHTYTIDFDISNPNEYLRVLYTSDLPSEGTEFFEYKALPTGIHSYTFNSFVDGYMYFYFYTYNYDSNVLTINSIKDVTSVQSNVVVSLVHNVGISQIWDIFDISINYIVVVVLVAFGLFIIFKLIKKVSKGKQGF